jgi:hypothetical protein
VSLGEQERGAWNGCRFVRDDLSGHYESYFQRANHPDRALAFWIRYTVFSPKNRPQAAVGELWAIYFDGETGRIAAAKEQVPIDDCELSASGLNVRVGAAILTDGALDGGAASGGHRLEWKLSYVGTAPPLLLLPRSAYSAGFPKAKALVGTPNASYSGILNVDGSEVSINGWPGSQNHNWGSRHTDEYAWGQVAGFDDAPDAFLECSTAHVRLGPLSTPWLTMLVLRVNGQEYALNSYAQALRAHARFSFFTWHLDSQGRDLRIRGQITAPAAAFAGLRYDNPPGGVKTCLNTKLASCQMVLERTGVAPLRLISRHRAAFEILTDKSNHGVEIVA